MGRELLICRLWNNCDRDGPTADTVRRPQAEPLPCPAPGASSQVGNAELVRHLPRITDPGLAKIRTG